MIDDLMHFISATWTFPANGHKLYAPAEHMQQHHEHALTRACERVGLSPPRAHRASVDRCSAC